MLQAFIITLREGVEAALIIGITVAYLAKIGRSDLRKTVYAGLIAAFIASIGVAIGISAAHFNPDVFEGAVMLVAAVFVVTMVWFMSRAAKTLKGDIERRVGGLASGGSAVGLFLFVFLMVLREGVETVLVLSAVSLTSSELFSFLGTLAGVALSIVFGVMFVKGSVRIDLRRFFKVTTWILIFVAIQLTISGLHELSENGVLRLILFEAKRRSPAPVIATDSKAEQRRAVWSVRRERLWMSAVYITSFVFIVLVTAEFIYAKGTTSLSPATEVTFNNGQAVISAADMQEGDLRRYSAVVGGKPVRFLIYKKPGGKIATVMDACAICGSVGFYNHGAQGITCKNCNAPINAQTVGEGGGCNPIPLVSSVNGNTVTVTQADFNNGAAQVHD